MDPGITTKMEDPATPEDSLELAMRKKFKTSELPLGSDQRAAIDSLMTAMKKRGEFDRIRKHVWAEFHASPESKAFTKALTDFADAEIDRDTSLLSRERGKAATLIEGAVDRSNIYKNMETFLEKLILKHLPHIEKVGREIRVQQVTEDVAVEEERKGDIPDEWYDQEVAVIRAAREKVRRRQEAKDNREKQKQQLREQENAKMAELVKLRHAQLRREEEQARQEARKAERAARKAAQDKLDRERREEREKKEAEEREKERQREEERAKDISHWSRDQDRDRNRHRDDDGWAGDYSSKRRSHSSSHSRYGRDEKPVPVELDEKALEAAALELLIREGRDAAEKSKPPIERERSESMEPPHRRGQPPRLRPLDATSRIKDEERSYTPHESKPLRGIADRSVTRDYDVRSQSSRSMSRDRGSRSYHEHSHRERSHRGRSRSRSEIRSRYTTFRERVSRIGGDADGSKHQKMTPAETDRYKRDRAAEREDSAERYKRKVLAAGHRDHSLTQSHGGEHDKIRRDSEVPRSSPHGSPPPFISRDRQRSASPTPRQNYHNGSRPLRAKSPVEIDRYIPPTSSRARGGGDAKREEGDRKGRGDYRERRDSRDRGERRDRGDRGERRERADRGEKGARHRGDRHRSREDLERERDNRARGDRQRDSDRNRARSRERTRNRDHVDSHDKRSSRSRSHERAHRFRSRGDLGGFDGDRQSLSGHHADDTERRHRDSHRGDRAEDDHSTYDHRRQERGDRDSRGLREGYEGRGPDKKPWVDIDRYKPGNDEHSNDKSRG